MNETDYRQDFIVTWNELGQPPIQEGFNRKNLDQYGFASVVENISEMYRRFNKGRPTNEHRIITKIESIDRVVIFP